MTSESSPLSSPAAGADLLDTVATLFSALSEPYLVVDLERVEVVFANAPARDYLVGDADQGFGLEELFPPEWDDERRRNELSESGETMSPVEWYTAMIGGGRWLRLEPALGLPRSRYAFRLRDVTEARDAADRRQRQRATRERDERFETAGRIAGALAHKFNNLLAVVLNNADLIAESDTLDDQGRDDLAQIRGAAAEAAALSRRLLLFGRSDLSKPAFIDVRSGLHELTDRISQNDSRHIEVRFEGEPGATIWAHPGQWEVAMTAIIDNALEASRHDDKVVVRVSDVDLPVGNVHNLPAGEYVGIEVEDDGDGMKVGVADRALEPFYSTKGDLGVGLGLSIAYKIATSFGGHVGIETMLGSGTTITMLLPRHTDPESEPDDDPRDATDVDVTGSTILVVEDEPGVLRAVQRILVAHGFNLLTATNGEEALKVFEEYEDAIDLLLTDVVMPGMSGVQLAKKVMRRDESIRVLYMSGYTESALSLDQLVAGKSDLILKPFTASDLLEVIEDHLSQ